MTGVLTILPEPQLEFAHHQYEEHPKDGLFLYGPARDSANSTTLKFGVIGTKEGLRLFNDWGKIASGYIPPFEDDKAYHAAFPGFEAAFGMTWPERAVVEREVGAELIENSILLTNRYEAIKKTVDIYANAIEGYLNNEGEVTPDFWYVVIPEIVFQWGRPTKTPPPLERVQGEAILPSRIVKKLLHSPSLFDADNKEAQLHLYDLNFHNQLKARLLGRAVIQIIRETTLVLGVGQVQEGMHRSAQDPATIAWNLCTTSYYKSAGAPWRIKDIRPGVCYVGIVFKKDPSSPESENACCGAQLFLRSGEGVVFRGAVGPWYSKASRQFHLTQEKAKELMELVIAEYERGHGEPPREVFIHGRTRFDEQEWKGFCAGKPDSTNVVGIRIWLTDELKLYRLAQKPPIRGTYYPVYERMAYLWTKGYVARYDTYPGFETPNPLAVYIDWGEADIQQVTADILALTKMNFNGCNFADGLPVTLKFADAIGEILTAAPNLVEAPQAFKYYI